MRTASSCLQEKGYLDLLAPRIIRVRELLQSSIIPSCLHRMKTPKFHGCYGAGTGVSLLGPWSVPHWDTFSSGTRPERVSGGFAEEQDLYGGGTKPQLC